MLKVIAIYWRWTFAGISHS